MWEKWKEVRFKNKPSDSFWLEVVSKRTAYFHFGLFVFLLLFCFKFFLKYFLLFFLKYNYFIEDEEVRGRYLKIIPELQHKVSSEAFSF